jgi:hypothetical protein
MRIIKKQRRALLVTLYLQADKSTTTEHHSKWDVDARAPALLKSPVTKKVPHAKGIRDRPLGPEARRLFPHLIRKIMASGRDCTVSTDVALPFPACSSNW